MITYTYTKSVVITQNSDNLINTQFFDINVDNLVNTRFFFIKKNVPDGYEKNSVTGQQHRLGSMLCGSLKWLITSDFGLLKWFRVFY